MRLPILLQCRWPAGPMLAAFAACAWGAGPAHGDDMPSDLVVRAEWIEIGAGALTKLLFDHPPGFDATALREDLAARVDSGADGVRVLETALVRTRAGQRAAVRSVYEHLSPTTIVANPGRKAGAPPVPLGLTGADLPSPGAFGTAEIGTLLEIDPGAPSGGIVDLNVHTAITEIAGERAFQRIPHAGGFLPVVKSPEIFYLENSTQASIRSGGVCLAAVLTPHRIPGTELDREVKVLLFLHGTVVTQEPPEESVVEADGQVSLLVEVVDVNSVDLTAILAEAPLSFDAAIVRESVRQLVREGRAVPVASPVVRTRSGQRARVHSGEVVPFAAEFGVPPGRDTDAPPIPSEVTAVDIATPTSFDTRETGVMVEVDPVITESGKHVRIAIAVQLVGHFGSQTVKSIPVGPAIHPTVQVPKFFANKVNTNITLAHGQWALAAALTPPGGDGLRDTTAKRLVFVRASFPQP